MAVARRLTRKEAKEVTRQRLLRAALEILNEQGEADVSASAVARAAGIAQPSFYEHFRNKDDLLHALGKELGSVLRQAMSDVRRPAVEAPSDEARQREQFRRPLETIAANPAWFRLALRARHLARSPLGRSSRELSGSARQDLIDEFVERGYPNDTPANGRLLQMIADGYIALTETLALGHVNGRYPDLEEIVDALVMFTHGPRELRIARSRSAAEVNRQ
jgi:AcrR family transcriptional regulator